MMGWQGKKKNKGSKAGHEGGQVSGHVLLVLFLTSYTTYRKKSSATRAAADAAAAAAHLTW